MSWPLHPKSSSLSRAISALGYEGKAPSPHLTTTWTDYPRTHTVYKVGWDETFMIKTLLCFLHRSLVLSFWQFLILRYSVIYFLSVNFYLHIYFPANPTCNICAHPVISILTLMTKSQTSTLPRAGWMLSVKVPGDATFCEYGKGIGQVGREWISQRVNSWSVL